MKRLNEINNKAYWSIILLLAIATIIISSKATRYLCRKSIDNIYNEIMENLKENQE